MTSIQPSGLRKGKDKVKFFEIFLAKSLNCLQSNGFMEHQVGYG